MSQPTQPPEGFHNVLNSHGYPFQYSVIRFADNLAQKGRSSWVFHSAEVPVAVQGVETKVDFILSTANKLTYMVAECKRVNPALGYWCFAEAPYTHRNPQSNRLFFETIKVSPLKGVTARAEGRHYTLDSSVTSSFASRCYHLGIELKSNKLGTSQGSGGRGTIEDAIGQVLRGVNGFVEYFRSNDSSLQPNVSYQLSSEFQFSVKFVPVIFTTASLWVSDVDLGATDLNTGDVK